MRHSLFYYVTLGFIIGIFASSVFDVYFTITVILFLLLICSATFLFIFKERLVYKDKELKQYSYFFLVTFLIFSATLGAVRLNIFTRDSGDMILKKYINQKIEAEGVVVEEPDERETSVRLTVLLTLITDKKSGLEIAIRPTKIILNDNAYSRITYGDKIKISGTLEVPENFESETGATFNYVRYLQKEKIFYEIKYPKLEYISSHNASRVTELLFSVKRSFLEKLNETISFPESRLAAGLTVAGKRALPTTIQDEFKRAGALQVVVLSGYNVTIIAEAFALMLSSLPKVIGMSTGIFSIVLFTIMAGGSATIVRGSIMSVLVVISTLLRRNYNITRALIAAAVIQLAWNPMLLVYDPSFQLSFLATLGLVVASPLLKKYFTKVPEAFHMREVVSATVAAQIFVTPFLLYSSGQISIVSFIVNILLSLVVPLTMLVSFIAGMLGYIHLLFAFPVSVIAYVLLTYELKVVHIFSSLPFALVMFPTFPAWMMFACYGSYVGILLWLNKMKRKPPTTTEINFS
jgi:competence protein ComEC